MSNKKGLLLSDSMSAISAIEQSNSLHPILFDIKNLIKKIENLLRIDFIWIRGHTGIEGNQRADHLAKEASSLCLNESIYDLMPVSFIKKHLCLQSFEEWNQQWLSIDKAKHTTFFSRQFRVG